MCTANPMTGLYIKWNIELKWIKFIIWRNFLFFRVPETNYVIIGVLCKVFPKNEKLFQGLLFKSLFRKINF